MPVKYQEIQVNEANNIYKNQKPQFLIKIMWYC